MPTESYVQVANDGSGKKVRNRALSEPQAVDATGASQADLVRYQQIVGVADQRGDLIADDGEILSELRAIHAALDHLVMLLT